LLSETPVIKILSAIHLDRGEAMIAAATFMLIFRFLHIVAGVLWVGSVFLFVGFIGPSAAEVAPSGQRLLTAAVKKRKVGTSSPAWPSRTSWQGGRCGSET
jgi:hypothetical protein